MIYDLGATIRMPLKQYYGLNFNASDIIDGYQRTELAKGSVPQAIACAMEVTSVEGSTRLVVSLGGDADTQAAIAGGIAKAVFGIDDTFVPHIKAILHESMQQVLESFYAKYVEQARFDIRTF